MLYTAITALTLKGTELEFTEVLQTWNLDKIQGSLSRRGIVRVGL